MSDDNNYEVGGGSGWSGSDSHGNQCEEPSNTWNNSSSEKSNNWWDKSSPKTSDNPWESKSDSLWDKKSPETEEPRKMFSIDDQDHQDRSRVPDPPRYDISSGGTGTGCCSII